MMAKLLNSCEFSYEGRVKTAHERTAVQRQTDATPAD